MAKLWLIARYEYRQRVLKKSFIMAMLSLPLIVIMMFALIAFSVSFESKDAPVGYVDLSGVLADPLPAPARAGSPDDPSISDLVPLVPYTSEADAIDALEAEAIQAYYLIASDYTESRQVELVFIKEPGSNVQRQFWDFMQINQLADLPEPVASRAVADSNVLVYWLDEDGSHGREFSQDTFLNTFWPLIAGIAFVFTLMASSGYLMGAVAEEKESRTMEIMVTSVSPGQMIIGKVVGILGVVVTQLAGWILFGALAVYVGANHLGIEMLRNLSIDFGAVATMAAVAAPSFVIVAALMTAVGATVAGVQEAQQVTGLFMIPAAIPLWLTGVLVENPNGVVSVVLSLLPITSVSAYSLRLTFGRVPPWQTISSIAIASVVAAGSLWVAVRAFRLGMLRYGQRLSFRQIFRVREEIQG